MVNATSKSSEFDVIVVGAGFGGLLALHHLRSQGLSVKVLEANGDVGGTWRANSYSGARCDVEVPFYSLDIPAVWQTWNWSERFAGWKELREYFEHFTKILDLRKDIMFKTEVISAQWKDETQKWVIESKNGDVFHCRYFISCVGTAFKSNTPDFPGLEKYKGEIYHSAHWPEGDVKVKGRRVAIIGQGASGVQVLQEWAKEAGELTVFVRTPNVTLPMYQRQLTPEEQIVNKRVYKPLFDVCRTTATSLPYEGPRNSFYDETPEQREEYMKTLWQSGGFTFSLGLYPETMTDQKVNDAVYEFWTRQVRPRIKNEQKRDLLAPLKPHFPFATKRCSLEQDYFEMADQDNVILVDVNKAPIKEFEATGIRTEDGKLYEFEALALCTGFDAIDGPLKKLGVKDRHGQDVAAKWSEGVRTSLGMFIEGMPNMFMIYGPQSPAAFTNGPIFIQQQVEWVAKMVAYLEKENISSIESTKEAVEGWRESILNVADATLFPKARSWYTGSNIPGKRVETMTYLQGVHTYQKSLEEAYDKLVEAKNQSTSDFIVHTHESKRLTQSIQPV